MQLWEESDAHIPLANHAQLISNGRHFREVDWHPSPQLVQAELVLPGSAPQAFGAIDCRPMACMVSHFRRAPLVKPPALTQESREASLTPVSSPKYSRHPSRAPSCHPSTPRSPSVASTRASTRASTPSLPDEEAREVMKTWVEHSQWLREDEKEPTVGAPGVPICALQLAEKGQSIYCCFLVAEKDRKGKILGYRSASDPNSTRDRLHRAIGRERVKFGHRPFKCPRNHDSNW
jgi:hypothetical protein